MEKWKWVKGDASPRSKAENARANAAHAVGELATRQELMNESVPTGTEQMRAVAQMERPPERDALG